MDYFNILISVNKISIFFFVITVLFVFYEFYQFQKDRRKWKDVPVKVPTIEGSEKIEIKSPPLKAFSQKPAKRAKKPNKKLLIGGAFLISLFGLLFVASYIYISQNSQERLTTQTRAVQPTAIPTPLSSPTSIPTVAPPTTAPTETLLAAANLEEEAGEEIIVEEDEEATEEAEITEDLEPSENQGLLTAGNTYYSLAIFAASIVFLLVAFVL